MANSDPGSSARLIKRYANRKLYDTGSGELTSLRRIEDLVRAGVDIRVIDYDTGEDMTGEVLVAILGHSVGERPGECHVAILTSLIRAPGDVLEAMFRDERRTKELRDMAERIRLLSATIGALLSAMESEAGNDSGEAPAPPLPSKARKPAARRVSKSR